MTTYSEIENKRNPINDYFYEQIKEYVDSFKNWNLIDINIYESELLLDTGYEIHKIIYKNFVNNLEYMRACLEDIFSLIILELNIYDNNIIIEVKK